MRAKCINRELTTEVIVGAFMMTVLLGLGYFTIILSREAWLKETHRLEVRFDDVMGLRDGDNVVYRGMPLGKVAELQLQEDGVHVVANLNKVVTLYEDYSITVVTTSILGGRHLQINEGTDSLPEAAKRDVYQGTPPYDLMGDAAATINKLREGLVENGTIDNLQVASEQLRDISIRVNNGEGFLGQLVSTNSTLYDDIAATAASLRTIAQRLEEGKSTLGKLLAEDDPLYDDLADTVASLKKVATRIEAGEGTLGKLMSDDAQVYDDLAATMKNARTISDRLEKGEGLAGRLLKDDSLYDQVSETVQEARDTLEDFREASQVSTFTSIVFGSF